jgi:copper(I)-binding protein
VEIPAGGSVAFAPGGLHVMLMDLQRPMVEGESFTMTLMLEDGGEIPVEVPILGVTARGPDE